MSSSKMFNSLSKKQVSKKNQIQQSSTIKKKDLKNGYIPQSQKPKFQSEDSQGSDISYQSSIESEDDLDVGRIQFFKEEMARFFINYPQLINHQIIAPVSRFGQFQEDYYSNKKSDKSNITIQQHKSNKSAFFSEQKKNPKNLNKNWTLIADQILTQAKQSSSFLQSLSHRIAFYRSKVQQQDLIDVLLKDQKNIMKEIDLQINQKKKETKGNKNTQNIQGAQNMFFSWRKRKQMENKLNLDFQKENHRKSISKNNSKSKINNSPKDIINKNQSIMSRSKSPSNHLKQNKQKLSQSILKKQNSANCQNKVKQQNISPTVEPQNNNDMIEITDEFFLTSEPLNTDEKLLDRNSQSQTICTSSPKNNKLNKKFTPQKVESPSKRSPVTKINKQSIYLTTKASNKKQSQRVSQVQNKVSMCSSSQQQVYWKHLVNFQPKTQAGRQLCQVIRKTNNPSDDLGIKKTILTFLSRNKDMVQNQITLKSTISQKIQKLYNDDSKQLLMFYPTKMTMGSNNLPQDKSKEYQFERNHKEETHQLFQEGDKFLKVLEDVVDGPLMKYWMYLQENKL